MITNLIAQGGLGDLSQTYFDRYFIAGGPKVWFILLPMSILALYLILDICFAARRKRLLSSQIRSDILTTATRLGVSAIPEQFAKRTDLVSRVLCSVYTRTQKITPSLSVMKEIAAESLQDYGLKLLRKTELCNLLGNVAPLVGLFGTVYGMIESFNQLGISLGQPKPGELAHGISIALVATYWGLMVAVPSLLFSGMFKVKIEGIIAEAAVDVEILLEQLSQLKPQSQVITSVVTPAPVSPKPMPQAPRTDLSQKPIPQPVPVAPTPQPSKPQAVPTAAVPQKQKPQAVPNVTVTQKSRPEPVKNSKADTDISRARESIQVKQ
jgi:biopolymer transport protein ExbB